MVDPHITVQQKKKNILCLVDSELNLFITEQIAALLLARYC